VEFPLRLAFPIPSHVTFLPKSMIFLIGHWNTSREFLTHAKKRRKHFLIGTEMRLFSLSRLHPNPIFHIPFSPPSAARASANAILPVPFFEENRRFRQERRPQ
jgi:hypothetical protein